MMYQAVRKGAIVLPVTALFAGACLSAAQPNEGGGSASPQDRRVEIRAEKLEYDRVRGFVTATGQVVAVKGDTTLKADFVRLLTTNDEVSASGNVTLERPGSKMKGDSLVYNFNTGSGSWHRVSGDFAPFQVKAESTDKAGQVLILHNACVTTCTNAFSRWHYHVAARRVELVPGKSLKTRNAIWCFGGVPVMYVPFWYRNLEKEWRLRFLAGYDSRMGSYLLSSVVYPVGSFGTGETHLDLRTERGAAVGQDLSWRTKNTRQELVLYYAGDLDPTAGDGVPDTENVDSDRYRLFFRESVALSRSDYMLLRLDYLSDPYMEQDFFERQYRQSAQPENYLTLTHRDELYTAGIVVRSRINDFFGSVNRLPEAYVDFLRRPIGGGIYYESRTAAGFLEREWPDQDTAGEPYSAFRLDSEHTLARPKKYFGFLNVIPRVGARGTYYSTTLETDTWMDREDSGSRTNIVVGPGGVTNVIVTPAVSTNILSERSEAGAGLRGSVEMGLETSFKGFKTWQRNGVLRRHVVEPYAGYTLIPAPSISPEDLHGFDQVDTLDEVHRFDVGMRNKLQYKDGGAAGSVVDVDVFARFRLGDDREDLPDVEWHLDSEFKPTSWLRIDADSIFDAESSELTRVDIGALMRRHGPMEMSAEYRYRNDDSSLLGGKLTWYFNDEWHLRVYGRYEFEDSRIEEGWAYVQRDFDCLAVKSGVGLIPAYTESDGTRRDDDWRFIIEFWLKAFPNIGVSSGHWE
jgi:lipopolysaccharide assembly outer membrane protein LptD (OstA)